MRFDFVDDVHNWHRWRSVQLGVLAAACGAGVAAYGAGYAIAPAVVSGVPHWIVTALTLGSMLLPIASVFARALKQDLPAPKPAPNSKPE